MQKHSPNSFFFKRLLAVALVVATVFACFAVIPNSSASVYGSTDTSNTDSGSGAGQYLVKAFGGSVSGYFFEFAAYGASNDANTCTIEPVIFNGSTCTTQNTIFVGSAISFTGTNKAWKTASFTTNSYVSGATYWGFRVINGTFVQPNGVHPPNTDYYNSGATWTSLSINKPFTLVLVANAPAGAPTASPFPTPAHVGDYTWNGTGFAPIDTVKEQTNLAAPLILPLIVFVVCCGLGAWGAGAWGFIAGFNVAAVLLYIYAVLPIWSIVIIGLVDAALIAGKMSLGKGGGE